MVDRDFLFFSGFGCIYFSAGVFRGYHFWSYNRWPFDLLPHFSNEKKMKNGNKTKQFIEFAETRFL